MVTSGALASTVVTGVLLLAVAAWVRSARRWRRVGVGASGAPALPAGEAATASEVDRGGRAWLIVALLVGATLVGAGVIAVEGALGASGLVAGLVGMVSVYAVAGTYLLIRSWGQSSARATMGALATLGALTLAGIALVLLAPDLV